MNTRLLFALMALISLPIFAAATNYDVTIEQNADRIMCLDSSNGNYYVKVGDREFAGHSVLYTQGPTNCGSTTNCFTTFVEMYASVIMCTGQYDSSKTVGTFTVHGFKDQVIRDNNIGDSGLCAVANKPPDINFVFATTPKRVPTPTNLKMMSTNVMATFTDDDNVGFAGLEWKLESTCFDTIEGVGFKIDKNILIPPAVQNCKIKLTVEDMKEGYVFTEFFVPSKKLPTPSN
jgi:hypothetical protein